MSDEDTLPGVERVVWTGDPAGIERFRTVADAGVEHVAAEDLRAALSDADACVVGGTPSDREPLSAAAVPVVGYADCDPADVATVADDFLRRRGDGDAERLVDRLNWLADRTDDRSKVEQLHDIASELLTCRQPAAVYDLVVEAAERVLDFDICSVDGVEDGRFVPKAVSEDVAEDMYDSPAVEDSGLAGTVYLEGESRIVDDVREATEAEPATEAYRSVLTVPVGDDAIFQAASREPGAFDETDRELAELLAAHAAGTLHRIRSEQAVRQRRETIERLHDIVAEMMACDSESDLFGLLVRAAERVLEFSVCAVVATDPDDDELRVRAASDDDLAPAVGTPVSEEPGLVQYTYEHGDAVLVEDVTEDEVANPHDERYRSAISVPLGEAGTVQAISTEPAAFDEDDLEMAELLASQAGAVLTRLRAERRRRRERDRLRALFDHVPDPAVSLSLRDGRPVVRDVNPAFEASFGYDGEAVVGDSLAELLVPGDGEPSGFDDLRAGESAQLEVRRETADGEVRDFIAHLVPTGGVDDGVAGYAIYTDITDRKRRERRLDSLHRSTRQLLAATDDAAVCEIAVEAAREILSLPATAVYRAGDGELELAAASRAAWGLFDGEPPTFGRGSDPWSAFEAGEIAVEETAEGEEPFGVDSVAATMTLPLGEHGVVVSASDDPDAFDEPTRDLAGMLAATVEAALTRTERERRLRERERELSRQNERLDEFASVVSHDLRSPLSVARGHLDLARKERDSEALAKVADAHDRMDRLIDDLLSLAREGQVVGDADAVDLEAVVKQAWSAAGSADAELTVASAGSVEADRDRLVQLLENLFRNAVEHGSTPRAGAGSASAEDGGSGTDTRQAGEAVDDAGPAVDVEVGRLDGDHWEGFYVADDGPGVPEADRERIFDRGFSTDDDGTGFGLAIVEEIAEAHGWSVAVTDSEAGGARFEVRTG